MQHSGSGMTVQTPVPVVKPEGLQAHEYVLTEVDENDPVYKEISVDLTNAGLLVEKLEKLSNLHLWRRFTTECQILLQQRESFDDSYKLNEKYLYHGTSAKTKLLICEEGLDHRMAKHGCFGKGIYFSDYPKKCVKYAERQTNHESIILLTRVILGESKVYADGEKDKALVREPEKQCPYTGFKFYDSVQGRPRNHMEFVVYDSRRVLVEYIVTYSRAGKAKTPSRDGTTSLEATETDNLESQGEQDTVDVNSDTTSDSDTDERNNLEDSSDSENDDVEEKNIKNQEASDSSDDETEQFDDANESKVNEVEDADDQKKVDDMSKKIISGKRVEFTGKTGLNDQQLVDHFLLVGDMDIGGAVDARDNMPKEFIEEEEQPPVITELVPEEIKPIELKPDVPDPDSEQWKNMSDEDKEAVIDGLIDDFRQVTGMPEFDKAYARRCLDAVNLNLDLAIIAHYELMASRKGNLW